MPLDTRVPQNGGSGIRLSVATSERRDRLLGDRLGGPAGLGDGARPGVPGPALVVLGLLLGRGLRRHLAALDRHELVHQPQALEGVAGVLHVAVEDLVEVLLDVGAGQRGAAEDDRAARRSRGSSSPARFSFMTTVDFTSSPDIPMTSTRCSCAASRIADTGCLMPRLITV